MVIGNKKIEKTGSDPITEKGPDPVLIAAAA